MKNTLCKFGLHDWVTIDTATAVDIVNIAHNEDLKKLEPIIFNCKSIPTIAMIPNKNCNLY